MEKNKEKQHNLSIGKLKERKMKSETNELEKERNNRNSKQIKLKR